MIKKIEVTIDVIIHATEDLAKILQYFEELKKKKKEEFTITETKGHFENPITLLNTKMEKKQAVRLMQNLLRLFSPDQIKELVEEIDERTIDSRYHLRLDKQELIRGNLITKNEKDAIKLKIHSPIYNKKDTVKIFTRIFHSQLD